MASDVIFKLNSELTAEQREVVLSRVKDLPGVVTAAPVRREATTGSARQLCFARLDAEADAERLAETLQQLPEVDYAEIPPKRGMA